jgi:phospholipid N-methyltransferase
MDKFIEETLTRVNGMITREIGERLVSDQRAMIVEESEEVVAIRKTFKNRRMSIAKNMYILKKKLQGESKQIITDMIRDALKDKVTYFLALYIDVLY